MIIWFTGQPGAGKTTLADAFIEKCQQELWFSNIPTGRDWYRIDGDDLREITSNKNYGYMGRIENVERAKTIAKYLDYLLKPKSNVETLMGEGVVVVSLVSPYRAQREDLKKTNRVLEVYVHTADIRGRENYHVDEYEPPLSDYLDMDTTNKAIEECVDEIFNVYRSMATLA